MVTLNNGAKVCHQCGGHSSSELHRRHCDYRSPRYLSMHGLGVGSQSLVVVCTGRWPIACSDAWPKSRMIWCATCRERS